MAPGKHERDLTEKDRQALFRAVSMFDDMISALLDQANKVRLYSYCHSLSSFQVSESQGAHRYNVQSEKKKCKRCGNAIV
jgi:hypothetical protein